MEDYEENLHRACLAVVLYGRGIQQMAEDHAVLAVDIANRMPNGVQVKGVYGLRCPLSGRIRYVGYSTHISRRGEQHREMGNHSSNRHQWALWLRELNEACAKFKVEVLALCGQDEEAAWIAKYRVTGEADLNVILTGTSLKELRKKGRTK